MARRVLITNINLLLVFIYVLIRKSFAASVSQSSCQNDPICTYIDQRKCNEDINVQATCPLLCGECFTNQDCGIDIHINVEDDFVVNGRKTGTHYPWMGSLGSLNKTTNQWDHRCGVSLIKNSYALTAAHCVNRNSFSKYRIRFGQYNLSMPMRSFGENMRNIKEIFIHDKFNVPDGSRYYDIAVLKFDSLIFSQYIKPICMLSDQIQPFLRSAISLGWGADKVNGPPQDVLHQVELTIFDERTCNGKIEQHSPDIRARYKIPLPEGYKDAVICAGTLTLGTTGLCQGDSGGPIMLPELSTDGQQTTWILFGLVSGGIPEFCGNREHPTRLVRLDDKEINNFIQKVIGDVQVSNDVTIDNRQKQILGTNSASTTPPDLNHLRQILKPLFQHHKHSSEPKCTYKRLKHTALYEGDHLGTYNNITPNRCEQVCNQTFRCQSFGYCPWYEGGSCFMFDKKINSNEPQNTSRTDCYTNFKTC